MSKEANTKSKLTLAYWLMLAKTLTKLKIKSALREHFFRYSPKAKSAKRRPITQTRFILRYNLNDDVRQKPGLSARSTAFTRETDKKPLPPKEPTLLNPWQPTNGCAPRTTLDQSQQSLRYMTSNQILLHKSIPANRGSPPLAKNE